MFLTCLTGRNFGGISFFFGVLKIRKKNHIWKNVTVESELDEVDLQLDDLILPLELAEETVELVLPHLTSTGIVSVQKSMPFP